MSLNNSYTSADAIPIKLSLHPEISRFRQTRIIRPLHISFYPTNKCNSNCSFCSCSHENRKLEFDVTNKKSLELLTSGLQKIGTEAITLSGGGEPLCHPDIDRIVNELSRFFSLGLATNGLLMKESHSFLDKLVWCRISTSSETDFKELRRLIEPCIKTYKKVDFALSYVLTENRFENVLHAINMANEYKMTHVRVVLNILEALKDTTAKQLLGACVSYLNNCDVDCSRVIFQDRSSPLPNNKCFLAYLKPIISPDLKVYYCCGVQYALDPPTMNLPDQLSFGSLQEFIDRYLKGDETLGVPVNCKYCYYMQYNDYLSKAVDKTIRHEAFV